MAKPADARAVLDVIQAAHEAILETVEAGDGTI
jgi:hypothetical protein